MCQGIQKANGALRAQLNDLEGRSQRLNVTIVCIKEAEEARPSTEFVSQMIQEPLDQDTFTEPVKIGQAQCSLRP